MKTQSPSTIRRLFAVLAGILFTAGAVRADVLWYNGDFNGYSGLFNGVNYASTAQVYQEFTVSDIWTINSVSSHNLTNAPIVGAVWEIRTGVSAGDGGTSLYGGSTAFPIVTATGNSYNSSDPEVGLLVEYNVEVTGLNVMLDPGTYWLNVTPIGAGGGASYVSTTSGANGVGTPIGTNGTSYWYGPGYGVVFQPTVNSFSDASAVGFSMGISGIPEPSAIALAATAVAALFGVRRRRHAAA